MKRPIIGPKDLQLADVVRLVSDAENAYSCMTVKQITDKEVTFFRPYVHTADFAYTGGVLCFIGIEEFQVSLSSTQEYELVQRLKTPLR
jgi:hypothetical protein